MDVLFLVIIFVLGASLGSFVNMLVFRTATKYGLIKSKVQMAKRKVTKRSFCDYCGRQLRWFENIPIISWVLQKGKTRCCRKKLPVAYPIVEFLTGVLFLICGLRFPVFYSNPASLIFGSVVVTMLVFSGVFDLEYMILPDFSTVILILVAFVGVVFDEKNIAPYLLAAMGGAGFLLSLHIITKGKGMGMGDVKYALFMGLLLGPQKTVLAFYVAFISGALVGVILMLIQKMGRKSLIPFGPFLILGTIVAWWFGEEVSLVIEKVLK